MSKNSQRRTHSFGLFQNTPLLLSFVNMVFWVMGRGVLNVDYTLTTLIWVVLAGIVMLIYYGMSGAMPRYGGGYAWGTRLSNDLGQVA